MFAVPADRLAAFLAGPARFLRVEFVGRAFLVGGLAALAGDGALGGFIHRRETSLGGAFRLRLVVS
jgi:hypothetical protein